MPYSITYLLQNMITMSGNVAATSLFYFWRLHHAHPLQHVDPDPAHQDRLRDADVLRAGQYHDHGR